MSISMANPAELVIPNYERQYGVHTFTMEGIAGDGIANQQARASVVSQPDWESFCKTIRGSSRKSLGTIALGPELITFPDSLQAIASQRELIEHRVDQLRIISLDYPDTTFVFGTPTFNDEREGARAHRPANSVIFVNQGQVAAQHNKQYPSLTKGEKDAFTFQQDASLERTTDPSIVALVCSDVIGEVGGEHTKRLLLRGADSDPEQLVSEDVRTVLISSSWASPIDLGPLSGDIDINDGRFRNSLETRVGLLFQQYPQIREVLIADRVRPDVEGVDGPYNARFTPKIKES